MEKAMRHGFMTTDELCEEYRICKATLYQHIHSGKLRGRKMGRKVIFLKPDIDAWVATFPDVKLKPPSPPLPPTAA